MAKLIFTGEKFAGRIYELVVEATTVGRGDANTLVIHDASVSQNHCEILLNGPEVIVRDLGSSNGTFVNGARLRNQQSQLLSGQIVKFGSVTARLELETSSPAETDTATDVTAIHAHARYRREPQQNPVARPLPAGMTLESDATAVEHTLMLPRPAAEANANVPASPPAPEPPKTTNRTLLMLLGISVALGLAALLWWLFGHG
jgi:pSer/pThr/pTyr-binding forkhead associated (FHA) protein